MRVDGFDFDLPEAAIALEPARPRDAARLLHVGGGHSGGDHYTDRQISDLPALLNHGDLLVVNDTKVLPVQLSAVRPARGAGGVDVRVDVTLHKQITGAGKDDRTTRWSAFVRPAKRVREGDRLVFADGFEARIISREGGEAMLAFAMSAHALRDQLLCVGAMPLPPYIARKRMVTARDREDYQTLYARAEGSVAAPTAGLHFTDNLVASLEQAGIAILTITLHVGAGTFLPVSVDDTDDHQMHSEWGEITARQAAHINRVRAAGGQIIAVGTTSLRLLESSADASGVVHPFCGETDIFITPGYRFRAVDRLMTNFHFPRSTLFMLVCAFAGTEMMQSAYAHAIASGYRFYSYGDACLLDPPAKDPER